LTHDCFYFFERRIFNDDRYFAFPFAGSATEKLLSLSSKFSLSADREPFFSCIRFLGVIRFGVGVTIPSLVFFMDSRCADLACSSDYVLSEQDF